ncbi:MAG TPA: type 1 glutamine amidotransferase domain-containing protein [Puia sp.]|nr:type 1 glutamine amidotransferase domain-containing protein [Puia sp.]
MGILQGKKLVILTENGFEEIELTSPKKAQEETGAEVLIASPQKEKVGCWDHVHWSVELPVDTTLQKANSEDYDALVVPGGAINPDRTGVNPECVDFAQHFLDTGKPVAAICHGPQVLIETGLLNGQSMTSFPSIRTDLENEGANWSDEEAVTDNGLVTS